MTPKELQIHTALIGYKWVFMRDSARKSLKPKWFASVGKPQLCGYWHTLSGMIEIRIPVDFEGTWKESLHGPKDLTDADHNKEGRRIIK